MNKLVAIAGGSTLVYIALALMMGVLPGIELSKTPPGEGVRPPTLLEAEGRAVYAADGCGYCHTQQVRPLAEDKVFGRPSAPGDFAYQTPELLGSERTGPDLTDVGSRRGSDLWQYIHLYNPRSVVPESIMPSFPWLFRVVSNVPTGMNPVPVPAPYAPSPGAVIPTHEAQALVAYLLSLKQTPLPPGLASGGEGGEGEAMGAPEQTAVASSGSAGTAGTAAIAHGQTLFTANCSACHQLSGTGLPGAFPALKGDTAVNDADPTLQVHTILFGAHGRAIGGVNYSSPMPPFGSALNDHDVADLVDYERSAWGNHGRSVSAAEVAAIRSRGQ